MSSEARTTRLLALAAVMAAALGLRQAARTGPPSWGGAAAAADPGRLRRLSADAPGRDRLEEARRAFASEAPEAWRDAVASPGRLSPSVFSALTRERPAAGARAPAGARAQTEEARAGARGYAPPRAQSRWRRAPAAGAAGRPPPSASEPRPRPGQGDKAAAAAASGRKRRARARSAARRAPAARGGDETEEEAASSAGAQASRARRRSKPEPSEAGRERPAPRQPRQRSIKPIRLSKLWGRGSIRPPGSSVTVPDLSFLDALKPKALPGGGAVPPAAPPAAVEALEPDALACRRKEGHWHPEEKLWHAGPGWGRAAEPGWAWLARAEGRWWAWTAAKDPAWLRWRDRWWWRKDGFWFLLHDGEPWGYRVVSSGYEGFYHAPTGTEMAYSRDGRYVAVVIPGRDALVFDAYTGVYLGTLDRGQLPPRKVPSAPAALRPLW